MSKAPDLSRFSGGAEANYGNYNFVRLAGNINAPLSDTVGVRVDAVYVNRDAGAVCRVPQPNPTAKERVFGQLGFGLRCVQRSSSSAAAMTTRDLAKSRSATTR